MQAYAWTKLLLNRDLKHIDFTDEILEKVTESGILRLPDGKKAVDTIADFLSQIYAYIPGKLGLPRGYIGDWSRVPIDFWFTIPAGWPEGAQSLMRQAIQKAGFGSTPLHRVWNTTEPEAAALAVFNGTTLDLEVSRTTNHGDLF